ncbi:uncharacterized protein LOC144449271 [Glandiceps talaboti]
MMRNSLYFGKAVGHVWFEAWSVNSAGGVLLVCAVSIFLTMLQSYLESVVRKWKRELNQERVLYNTIRQPPKYQRLELEKIPDQNLRRALSIHMDLNRWVEYAYAVLPKTETCHVDENKNTGLNESEYAAKKSKPSRKCIDKRRLKCHICDTILHLVTLLTGYLIMLLVMNYNVWILLSAVVGGALGYFLFKRDSAIGQQQHDASYKPSPTAV